MMNQPLPFSQYLDQLRDPRWFAFREQIKNRDQHRCRHCGSASNLQVHHRQYHVHAITGSWKAPWEYDPALLVTLCKSCHEAGHKLYKVPVFPLASACFQPANRLQAASAGLQSFNS